MVKQHIQAAAVLGHRFESNDAHELAGIPLQDVPRFPKHTSDNLALLPFPCQTIKLKLQL